MSDRAAAVQQTLHAHPWPGVTPRLALLDFDVVFRTTDPQLASFLTQLFEPLACAGDAAHTMSLMSTRVGRATRYSVHLDATTILTTPAPAIALAHLLWEANRQAIERTRGLVLVHAAAATSGDAAIIVAGPMGAGKSTLVTALARHGLGYLSDEIAAIDPDTGVVRPYPKYVGLDPMAPTQLADLRDAHPSAVDCYIGEQLLVAPRAFGPNRVSAPARPGLVITPRYEPGAPARLEPLRPAAALLALAEHSFHLEADAPRVLDTLAAVVEHAPAFRLVSGDLDDSCALVLGALDELRVGA